MANQAEIKLTADMTAVNKVATDAEKRIERIRQQAIAVGRRIRKQREAASRIQSELLTRTREIGRQVGAIALMELGSSLFSDVPEAVQPFTQIALTTAFAGLSGNPAMVVGALAVSSLSQVISQVKRHNQRIESLQQQMNAQQKKFDDIKRRRVDQEFEFNEKLEEALESARLQRAQAMADERYKTSLLMR